MIKKIQKLASLGALLKPSSQNVKIDAPKQTFLERASAKTLSREGINQTGNIEPKGDPEGAGKLHRGDWSFCLQDHYKLYALEI